jgi:hypothetical protein
MKEVKTILIDLAGVLTDGKVETGHAMYWQYSKQTSSLGQRLNII